MASTRRQILGKMTLRKRQRKFWQTLFLDRIIREEAIMAGVGQQGSADFEDKAESDQNT